MQLFLCLSLHLNTLFLTNLGTLKDEGVLDFLCHTPDIQIRHLSLRNITCSLQKCQNQWDSIFCDWNLCALEFCCCDIGLLPLITQGLRKQLSCQTLHSFTLCDDTLGKCLESEICLLFDTIFSPPNLHELYLNISKNHFTIQHYNLLYMSRKK